VAGPGGVVQQRDHITDVRPDRVLGAVVDAREVPAELVDRVAHGGRELLVHLAGIHRVDRHRFDGRSQAPTLLRVVHRLASPWH